MSRAHPLDIARCADLRPAYEHFVGRVTASMIREHGSYEAAKSALYSPAACAPAAAVKGEGAPVNPLSPTYSGENA